MSTHLYGMKVSDLERAQAAARVVDHSVVIVDDAAHVAFVIDVKGNVVARVIRDDE